MLMQTNHFSPPDPADPQASPSPWPGRATLIALLLMTPGAFASSDQSGTHLAWKYKCVTCHGETGVANSDRYPNLGGQNAAYLEARLKSFRAMEDPRSQMNVQALPLSDDDIAQLAAYYSRRGAETE